LAEIRQIVANTRSTWQPLFKSTQENKRWENLFSGSAARGAVGYILMPITVVKVRYEVSCWAIDKREPHFLLYFLLE
jgi:solute carrier family 25 protein 38